MTVHNSEYELNINQEGMPYPIESTLRVIRPGVGETTEPLDKLATHSRYHELSLESPYGHGSTSTVGQIKDAVLNIIPAPEAKRQLPVQDIEIVIDSDISDGKLGIEFNTRMLRFGNNGFPGQVHTNVDWNASSIITAHTDRYIHNGMTILNGIANLGITTSELHTVDYMDFTKPHAKLFNAAAYLLVGNTSHHKPDVAQVNTEVRSKDTITPDQREMAIYALESMINNGIAKHATDLARNTNTFFGISDQDTRTGLLQSILGTAFAELGKKNLHGRNAGELRYDDAIRESHPENAPTTIFDLVHADQREKTNEFFNELCEQNYEFHAQKLLEKFRDLANHWNEVPQTIENSTIDDEQNLKDIRDSFALYLQYKLYPHLGVYSKCEYVDVLNPAMVRTIESYCNEKKIPSSDVLMDIIDVQNNLLTVMVTPERFEAIVRPDLDLNGELSITDFNRGQLRYEAGSFEAASDPETLAIINAINLANSKLREIGS